MQRRSGAGASDLRAIYAHVKKASMDTLSLIVQSATVLSVFVAAATIWASRQMNRRQMNMQVFTAYNDRYERLMSSFSKAALRAFYNETAELPPDNEDITMCALRYLNLSSEEYHLWQEKYVERRVWALWEHEIKRVLRTPLMKREWQARLKVQFAGHAAFAQFVDTVQQS
jgi:hypothetical protein